MRMPAAPPVDYVAFVDRRLPELRARVAREVPDVASAQVEILADVLADLAGRWAPLRAAARWLGRPELTDRFLDRSVRRRGKHWRDQQIYPVEMVVWDPATHITQAAPVAPAWTETGFAPVELFAPGAREAPPPPRRISVALRRASVIESTVRPPLATVAEASIAWWHAYEARRRAIRVTRLTLACLGFLLLWLARG